MYATAEVEKWTQTNVKAEDTSNSTFYLCPWVRVNSALVFFFDQNLPCWDRKANHLHLSGLPSEHFAVIFGHRCRWQSIDLQYLQNWYIAFNFSRACVREAFPVIPARGHRMYLLLRASFACNHRTQGTPVGKLWSADPYSLNPVAQVNTFTSRTFIVSMRLLITQIE